jgi:hypothetical protein
MDSNLPINHTVSTDKITKNIAIAFPENWFFITFLPCGKPPLKMCYFCTASQCCGEVQSRQINTYRPHTSNNKHVLSFLYIIPKTNLDGCFHHHKRRSRFSPIPILLPHPSIIVQTYCKSLLFHACFISIPIGLPKSPLFFQKMQQNFFQILRVSGK